MSRKLFVLIAATCFTASLSASENPAREGKWQVTTAMEMPGIPVKIPPMTVTVCITKEDLKSPEKSLPKQQGDCKFTDYAIDGNTVSWAMKCEGKTKGSGKGSITYSETSYTGGMEMNMDGQSMKARYTGKRLGDCTK